MEADFDNTGVPTKLWRFGRDRYDYQYIYWSLLGQGDTIPEVDDALRPTSGDKFEKRVLPGEQHNRLRRTLTEQSSALGNALHRSVTLPAKGQFFLFKAHKGRTYWGWDIDEPPHNGSTVHIMYTNAHRSDYIGTVDIRHTSKLLPCESECIQTLQ